ncbi:DUF862-domain-containing protein [Cylindrobasidium torrendii FP15055 ss-10]|uniref:DUF862-domain-containing protein n=1 Tax=Cylindrobasidium torrendii FP15055 ss-10 TaxID=1314674 RepID=A0A0D7AZJ7_9AGAR|nr:DUF862-domain-containing protein [Cylindrobasidium torrendii FP15055 ss-10]
MNKVKLYVYDLSNGLAKQLSRQLTGRQIDGIWHTSIVVFGKEVFYGQGIDITAPGRSHHGAPLQVVDLGETAIDSETFDGYIEDLRQHYTADKYHLLEFNCNSFTNDVSGFLTGNSIPAWISDLPSDFLSTPFGQSLRPTIDAMYRRPSAPGTPAPASTPSTPMNADLAGAILQAVANQAQGAAAPQANGHGLPATESLAAPLHPCTNSASFQNLLRTHKAVVANFSNVITCGPCRMIAPIYESLAHEKGVKVGTNGVGAAFTKIDMSAPGGNQLASEMGVRVMPTFMFFLDGKKVAEMKGANQVELKSQIDLLIYQAYPPHPHTSLSLPAFEAVALKPILFTQYPNLDAVSTKLVSFIDAATWPESATKSATQIKSTLYDTILPYLKSRAPTSAKPTSATPVIIASWSTVTTVLINILPPDSIFPLVDMWRLAYLDAAVAKWSAANTQNPNDPLTLFLSKASVTSPRNYTLTLIRLLSNAFATPLLASRILGQPAIKQAFTNFLVPNLLHDDASVRTSAASLAFNASASVQQSRVEKIRNGGRATAEYEDEEWEAEVVSAIVEALNRETSNEDVVHRLTASLACLLRASPFYEGQIGPLLEVLGARGILESKTTETGCVKKAELKKLVAEVASKLCP